MGKLPIIPFHKRYDVEFGSLATGLLPVAEDIPETASFLPQQSPWRLGHRFIRGSQPPSLVFISPRHHANR